MKVQLGQNVCATGIINKKKLFKLFGWLAF